MRAPIVSRSTFTDRTEGSPLQMPGKDTYAKYEKLYPQKYRKCFSFLSGEMGKNQLVRLRCHWFTALPDALRRIGCQIPTYKTMPSILHRNGNFGRAVIGLCDMSFSFDLFSAPQWYFDKCYDGYVIMPIGERCAHTKTGNLWLTTFRVTGLRWLTIKTSSLPFDHSVQK